jgi:RNA polymerase sigma-70 factor (ECF subfamily)
LDRWRVGEEEAAARLYARYVQRLRCLAESRIGEHLQGRVEADDVLQSVFRTFFRRTRQGEYPAADTDGIWYLLVRITLRKVAKAVERQQMQKRNPAQEVHDEAERLAAGNPTPDEVVALLDELQCLATRFDERDREIIERLLDGQPNGQIAAQVGLSEATVRRVVERFKYLLEKRLQES